MEIVIFSFRGATGELLSDLQKRVFQLLPLLGRMGGFGLLRVTLLIFVYLTLHYYDILSMRLGRQIFEGDTACPQYPQPQDSFGSHTLACHILGGKSILHNMIRDEIYRTLQGGNLHRRLLLSLRRSVNVEIVRRPKDVIPRV